MINGAIFPAPKRSYELGTFPHGELVHIPRFDVPYWNLPAGPESEPTGTGNRFRPSTMGYTVGLLLGCPAQYRPQYCIIYAHPNAADIGHLRDEFVYLRRPLRAHCLLVEYQGYGLCDANTPSEEETNVDVESAFEWVVSVLGVPPERIILVGRSIGTGPTARLCATLPKHICPAMLVLECPFSSIKDSVRSLADAHAPKLTSVATSCVADRFNTKAIIGNVVCPVVIIHGDKDDLVPIVHSETLLAAAKAAGKQNIYFHRIPTCGHNDIPWAEILKAFDQSFSLFSASLPCEGSLAVNLPPWYCAGRNSWELLQSGAFGPVAGQTRADLASQLTYNFATFGSLVRFGWELYLLRQDHDGPGLLANVADSLRDWTGIGGSSQESSAPWTLPRFFDACLTVWGSPLGIYRLVPIDSTNDARKGGAETNEILFFGNAFDTCRYDVIWQRLARSMVQAMALQLHSTNEKQATASDLSTRSIPAPDIDHFVPDYALFPLRVYGLPESLRSVLLKNIEALINPYHTVESLRKVASDYLGESLENRADSPSLPKLRAFSQRGLGFLQMEVERFVIDALSEEDEFHFVVGVLRNLGQAEVRAAHRADDHPLASRLKKCMLASDLELRQVAESSEADNSTPGLAFESLRRNVEAVKRRDSLIGSGMSRAEVDANSAAWNNCAAFWCEESPALAAEALLMGKASSTIGGGDVAGEVSDAKRLTEVLRNRAKQKSKRGDYGKSSNADCVVQ